MDDMTLSLERMRRVEEAVACGRSVRDTVNCFSTKYRKLVRKYYWSLREQNEPIVSGTKEATEFVGYERPDEGEVRRYLLTCAQNNTHLHKEFWHNLKAFARHIDAKVMVSRFSYDTGVGARSQKVGRVKGTPELWYASEIADHICDDNVMLAPDLVFFGRMNVLPTAVRPLSGLEGYGRGASGIFPHVKHAMDSIPRMPADGPQFNYTTGTVTQINYIQRKAGQKAEFHHIFGAILVEVDGDGRWWARQINASSDGSFQDLDRHVTKSTVHTGRRVDAIIFGDLHQDVIDKENAEACWGDNGIVERLHPRHQIFHDALDMRRRSHHTSKDPVRLFELWRDQKESVQDEIQNLAMFLKERAENDGGKIIVVDSNHDRSMHRWLDESIPASDPVNARVWLDLNSARYKSLAEREERFHLIEYACRKAGCPKSVEFLREDDSYVLHGIEHGLHGDRGPNGARGNVNGLMKMGKKISIGHVHSAQILDGVFVAGTSSKLRLDYTYGPTSWSHSHIILYPNGKRAIMTIRDGLGWG